MELFTFLRSGGTMERISIRLLSEDKTADLQQMLLSFDGGRAECFLPSDRERLVAVIEAGFGYMAPFNLAMRKIFSARMGELFASSSDWINDK